MFRLINIPYLNRKAYPNTEEHRSTEAKKPNCDKQTNQLLGTWKNAGSFELVPRNKRGNGTGQPNMF